MRNSAYETVTAASVSTVCHTCAYTLPNKEYNRAYCSQALLLTICASSAFCVSLIWNLTNSLLSLLSLAAAELGPLFFSKRKRGREWIESEEVDIKVEVYSNDGGNSEIY